MSLQTQPAAPLPSQAGGRLTLPIQTGMDEEVRRLIARLGADAVRNSDGTELPGIVSELATKVYSTYFVGRGDNTWADAHPQEATRIFLMSDRVTATALKARLLDQRAAVRLETSHLGQWASSQGAALVALESVLDNPSLVDRGPGS